LARRDYYGLQWPRPSYSAQFSWSEKPGTAPTHDGL
jgi:hypothetical protein